MTGLSRLVLPALIACSASTVTAQEPRAAVRAVDVPTPALRDQPEITTAALRVLPAPIGGRPSALVVTFAAGVGATVSLTLNGEALQFRDDGTQGDERAGDRRYTALSRLTLDSARVDQANMLRAARQGLRPTLFRDRVMIGRAQVDTGLAEVTTGPAILDTLEAARRINRFPIRRDQLIRPRSIIPILPFSAVDPATVDIGRSLIINAPGVVTDPARTFNPCGNVGNPNGVWTFKHAMTSLANTPVTGIPADQFTRRWLRRWTVQLSVNDRPSLPRSGLTSFLNAWLAASGGTTLNLDRAPFRLLAIVNRIDLRENLTYGGGSAGEGRLVFGAVNPANPCSPHLFTVIFEYGITKGGCVDLKAWAQQWQALSAHALGSPAYNTALAAITEQFVAANTDLTQFPNRSSLNQLRTNEFLNFPWQLREFRLAADDADVGHLRQVTVKQNPRDDLNSQQVVADFVNPNAAAILAGTHVVPAEFPVPPGVPFLAPHSDASAPGIDNTVSGDFWDGPGTHPSAAITTPNSRHRFSFNTCDGCHTGETSTFFTHIKPEVTPGAPGSLSKFMLGAISVPDPAGEQTGGAATQRTFNEPLARQQSMADVLGQTCRQQILFRPLRAVH